MRAAIERKRQFQLEVQVAPLIRRRGEVVLQPVHGPVVGVAIRRRRGARRGPAVLADFQCRGGAAKEAVRQAPAVAEIDIDLILRGELRHQLVDVLLSIRFVGFGADGECVVHAEAVIGRRIDVGERLPADGFLGIVRGRRCRARDVVALAGRRHGQSMARLIEDDIEAVGEPGRRVEVADGIAGVHGSELVFLLQE
jgi:hypothetical protein